MDEPNKDFVTGQDGRKTVYIITTVIVCIGAAFSYWAWPTEVTDLTLQGITFDQMLLVVESIGIIAITLGVALCLVI